MKWILTDKEIAAMEARCQARAFEVAIENFKRSEEAKRLVFNEEQAKFNALMAARDETGVHFNFNDPNVVAFSVERVDHNTPTERTLVGYYLKSDVDKDPSKQKRDIREWHLYCGRKSHNDLVNKFNASPAAKEKQLLQG